MLEENVNHQTGVEAQEQTSVTEDKSSAKVRKMTDYELDTCAYDLADDLKEYAAGRKVFLIDICERFNCAKNVAEAIFRRSNRMVQRYFDLDVEFGFESGPLKLPSFCKRGIMVGANHVKQHNGTAAGRFQIKEGDKFNVSIDETGCITLTPKREASHG